MLNSIYPDDTRPKIEEENTSDSNASDYKKNPLKKNPSDYLGAATAAIGLGQFATSKENFNDGYDGTGVPTMHKVDTGATAIQGATLGAKTGAAIGSIIPGVGTVAGTIGGAVLGSFMGAFKGSKDRRRARERNILNGQKYYAKTQQEREERQKIEEGMDVIKNKSEILKSQLGYNVKY